MLCATMKAFIGIMLDWATWNCHWQSSFLHAQAISVIAAHRTDDMSALPPVRPAPGKPVKPLATEATRPRLRMPGAPAPPTSSAPALSLPDSLTPALACVSPPRAVVSPSKSCVATPPQCKEVPASTEAASSTPAGKPPQHLRHEPFDAREFVLACLGRASPCSAGLCC